MISLQMRLNPALTNHGCVSTQRYNHDYDVGFANRDFTTLFLKKAEHWVVQHKYSDFQVEANALTI